MPSNLERMIALAESFFDAKNDPEQLSVTEEDRAKLLALHPACLSEERDGDGPVAWLLLFPTTDELMRRFLTGAIGERQLLHETPATSELTAVYLCSALMLEEYRGRGIARRMALSALRAILADHPIQTLFVWSFSPEGERLASAVAADLHLPLLHRAGAKAGH